MNRATARPAGLIVRKGFHDNVDSYSAFLEADKTTHTGLASYFKECGIDAGGSLAKAWAEMTAAGVKKIQSSDIAV